eukprot:comp12819_c0_seq1/m.7968 comp12819_c0_seq1/g.7968  ORF comp12819_c0_seq1/g.7968 comp12819_c0_seq1/m.7968 type:complete len:412 (+) comp12819_c0_seq1:772-2007(+)
MICSQSQERGVDVGETLEIRLVDLANLALVGGRQHRRLLDELLVELRRVLVVFHGGHQGGLDLALFQAGPLEALKEVMAPNLPGTLGLAPQPLGGVPLKEPLDAVPGHFGNVGREMHIGTLDSIKQLILRLGLECRAASHHLKHQNAQGPPVHTERVVQLQQNLGGNVVRCAAERGRGVPGLYAVLAHAKVCKLDVALAVQKHVVQLEITVDDALTVKIVEGRDNLSSIELRTGFGEVAVLPDLEHQITTVEVLHHKEKTVVSLEGGVELSQKGAVPSHTEHGLLHFGTLKVIVLHNVCLLEHLDCKHITRALALCKHHLAEAATAQHGQEVEVVEGHVLGHRVHHLGHGLQPQLGVGLLIELLHSLGVNLGQPPVDTAQWRYRVFALFVHVHLALLLLTLHALANGAPQE